MTEPTMLERLAERGNPAGPDHMISRLETNLVRGSEPVVADASNEQPLPRHRTLPAFAAGLAVLIVLGGGWWLLSPADRATTGPVAQQPDEARPDALATELAASPLPGGVVQWPEFSMSATLGAPTDNEPGLQGIELRWADPEAWRWEEWKIDPDTRNETVLVTYQSGGTRYEPWGRGDVSTRPAEAGLPLDWFDESIPPALAWVLARPNADLRPELVEPEHPLASVAAVAGGDGITFRMEFTADGIPVLRETDPPLESDFWVGRLDQRGVSQAEIRTGLPPGSEADTGQRTNPEVVRTIEVDGITVEVVVSEDCVDYDVYSESGTPAGSVGGCGHPPRREFDIPGIGGVRVDGQWVQIIDGGAGPEIDTVRAVFMDGTVLSAQPQDGLWLMVRVIDPPPNDDPPDVVFEALDQNGDVLTTTTFPKPPERNVETLQPEETGG